MIFKPKHIIPTLISFFFCAGLHAQQDQYAIRPGLELPELQINTQRVLSRDSEQLQLPTYVDNSLSDFFPAVVNQHGGSCAQASGIHYLFTYEMNRVLERKVSASPKAYTFSYRYTWHYLNEGKDQGSISSDGLEIVQTAGCMTVSDYGNEDESVYRWVNGYTKYYNAMHYKAKNISSVSLRTREGIEKLMAYMVDKNDGHPGGGIAGFSVSGDWSIYNYSGPSQAGITNIMRPKGSGGAHAMTLIGYDLSVEFDCDDDGIIDDDEKGAFIFINSWGTWWGNDGKAYMPFSAFTRSIEDGGFYRFDGEAKALCTDAEYQEPTLAMEVNLTYSSRNDLNIRFGVADGAQSTKPDKGCFAEYKHVLKAQGGDLRMQGTYFETGKTITMGFDLSELKAAVDTMKAPCWYLIVSKVIAGDNGSGNVNEIKLHDYRNGKDSIVSASFKGSTAAISTGTRYFKIMTKDWFKDSSGKWYRPVNTSASKIVANTDYMQQFNWNRIFAVRKSKGGFAKIKITGYDPKTKKLTFKANNYELK